MNQTRWNPPISQFIQVKILLLKMVAGWNSFFLKHRFHILHFPNSTGLFTKPTGGHYTKYRFSPDIVRRLDYVQRLCWLISGTVGVRITWSLGSKENLHFDFHNVTRFMLHTLVLGMLGTPRGLCPDCVGPSLQNEQCSTYILIALREWTNSKVAPGFC